MLQSHFNHSRKRRIAELFSLDNFSFEHPLVIMIDDILHHRMIGVRSLHDYLSAFVLSARAPCHLHHQLKCTFMRAVTRMMNQLIGADDSYETNVVEIQSL